MAPTAPSTRRADIDLAAIGHPRGTLAIVAVFGFLFLVAWLATYVFIFIGRGAPQQ